MYRIYEATGGHEFGIDYKTPFEARKVKSAYQVNFPNARYYIRKVA